jgi:hypothetical protein
MHSGRADANTFLRRLYEIAKEFVFVIKHIMVA